LRKPFSLIGLIIYKMAINIVNNLTHTINKLRITQVDDNSTANVESSVFSNFINNAAGDSKVFEVQINPDKYVKHFKNTYTRAHAQNKSTPSHNFHTVEGQDLTINFTLDGTGVISTSVTDLSSLAAEVATDVVDFASRSVGLGGVTDTSYVTRRIEALRKVVYDFNPKHHKPPTVVVTWGDVPPFKGKLTDLQVTYTLFSPNGAPLRAEIQVQFKEHGESVSQSGGAGAAAGALAGLGASIGGALLSSPDLTHRRTVKATDTLPLLCGEIYRDTSFYWQVAQANNLTHFRELEVGAELFFPPIER
jgi:Contractile injection system tube protein